MDYYERRRRVMTEIRDYLYTAQEGDAKDFDVFQRKLIMDYGATDSMIQSCLEKFGLKLEGGKIVKLNSTA